MKNIIALMGIVMLCYINANAQKLSEARVPTVVKTALKSKFTAATDISWEVEHKDAFEASFTNGQLKQSAVFDKTGKWEATETKIQSSALPKAVADSFAKEYAGYTITGTEHIEAAKGDLYELEIKGKSDKLEIQYSPDGKVVKKETLKD